MSILSHPRTYSDLQQIREQSDRFVELIEGELVVTPAPTPLHQLVSQRLYDLLKLTVVDARLGRIYYAPLDVYFDDQNVLQPDLLVLLRDRIAQIGDASVEGPPSLVIEICSPSTAARDHSMKRDMYARHSVPEYWLVDPMARSVAIFSDPRDGHYQNTTLSRDTVISATIAGLSADVAALFAPEPDL